MIFWIVALRAELSYEEIGHLENYASVGIQKQDAFPRNDNLIFDV
jgi:hypothetical protein